MSHQIVRFKKDLRIHDHRSLAEPSNAGSVLPVYVYEPGRYQTPKEIDRGRVFQPDDLEGSGDQMPDAQSGGRNRGNDILNSFLSTHGKWYRSGMYSPVSARNDCSRLSPYLTFGTLSLKEVYQATHERQNTLRQKREDEYIADPSGMPRMIQKSCGCEIGEQYPESIVDGKEAWKRASKRIWAVKDSEEAQETDEIYEKHGSRRNSNRSSYFLYRHPQRKVTSK